MGQRAMEVEVVIPANTLNENVLAGKLFQITPGPCIIGLLATGSAAGLAHSLIVGGSAVFNDSPLNANNRQPIEPDDLIIQGVEALGGWQLFLAVRNTTGGNLTYRARVVLLDAQMG